MEEEMKGKGTLKLLAAAVVIAAAVFVAVAGIGAAKSGSASNGTTNVTYKYKKTSQADSRYTTTRPTSAGDYTLQATFAETQNYKAVVATTTFFLSFMFFFLRILLLRLPRAGAVAHIPRLMHACPRLSMHNPFAGCHRFRVSPQYSPYPADY